MSTYLKGNILLHFAGGAVVNAHFEATLNCKKAFWQFFSKPYVRMLFQYLENVYIFKSDKTLHFVGGAATDAHFEVTLKCKKGLFGNFSKKLIH